MRGAEGLCSRIGVIKCGHNVLRPEIVSVGSSVLNVACVSLS